MRRYFIALIGFIFINTQFVAAQEPLKLSLNEAVDYAQKNNVSVKNARLDVLIQKAKNNEITGIAYPQANISGQYQDFFNAMKSFIPGDFFRDANGNPLYPAGSYVPVNFTPKYSANASGAISQIIFDGSVMVALQAKKTVMKLVQLNANLTVEDTRYNVQKSYNALVIAQKQFEILKNTIANARKLANDVVVLKENGFAEKIDVDRSNVQINNLVSDSIRISSLLDLSEQVLKFSMGMPINQPIILTDTAIENNLEGTQALLDNVVDYKKRTEYNLLETQLKLNEYDLKRHRLSKLPSLSAFANAGFNYSTNTGSEIFKFHKNYQSSSLWGLQLNIPVFDGFQKHNRIKQAQLNIEKTKNSIEGLSKTIDFQAAQSRTSLKNALLTLQNQSRNKELANVVLDLAERKYKEGVGSNIEVTQAQNDYLQAQNNYFQAMLDAIIAQADFQKALGILNN